MKTSELKSQTKFETEFFLKFYEKKKCENYHRWSIQSLCKISDSLDSHHLRKEGKWTESNQGTILFPRPVPRRIGTAEAPSKNFRQGYYQLVCLVICWWILCSLILKIITKLIQNVRNSGKRQSRWWFILCTIAFVIYIYKMIEFHSNFMSFL